MSVATNPSFLDDRIPTPRRSGLESSATASQAPALSRSRSSWSRTCTRLLRAPITGLCRRAGGGLRRLDGIADVDVVFLDGRTSWTNYLRGAREVRKALRAKCYDIVHAHYGLAGAIAAAQTRIPVVVTYHSGDIDFIRWHRWISRVTARAAALNICVCEADMPKLRAPSVYIPCGIDLESFRPPDRAGARHRHGLADDDLALLFPGPREHRKKAYYRFEEVREALRARGHKVVELRLEK